MATGALDLARRSRRAELRPSSTARLPAATAPEVGGRIILHDGAIGLVERAEVNAHSAPSGFETHYQVVLPYYGLFAYEAGAKRSLFDAHRVLFVRPDREFRDTHPVAGVGHGSIIITPKRGVLDELCGVRGAAGHSAFEDANRASSPMLRLLAHQLLTGAAHDDNPLRRDEWAIAAVRRALASPPSQPVARVRVVEQAQQLLHARGFDRLSLGEIAAEIGVTSVYLTQEFTRVAGVPLYRYQLALRLNRALGELPHTGDITALALDLGFSSHSHFSAAFRSAFGMTPSQYREGGLERRG